MVCLPILAKKQMVELTKLPSKKKKNEKTLAQKYKMEDLEIYSTPPLIYKMFGKYRYNIILK